MKLAKVVAFVVPLLALNAFAGPVDVNTADAKTLAAELKGVGPKTAGAIVVYRDKHGPFKTADDLAKVKGVGKKTIEKNRANILVGKPAK